MKKMKRAKKHRPETIKLTLSNLKSPTTRHEKPIIPRRIGMSINHVFSKIMMFSLTRFKVGTSWIKLPNITISGVDAQ